MKKHANETRRLCRVWLVAAVLWIAASPVLMELADGCLKGVFSNFGALDFDFNYKGCWIRLFQMENRQKLLFFCSILYVCSLVLWFNRARPRIAESEMTEAAKGIFIPVPAGNGEYGTARFMTAKEMDEQFSVFVYSGKGVVKDLSPNAGIIVSYERQGKKETIRYLTAAVNVLILGATRCGKTRRLLLTSIWLALLAGVNQLLVDVKGELYAYTNKFAKNLGYEVRVLDFRYPDKSMHFNNLGEINNLLKERKIPDAVNKAWDIVSVLVGEPKGERIWTDGQCATIAAAILIVAQDAPEWAKNLTNVYYFLAYMCEVDEETGAMPITDYLNRLPHNHPARGAFQVAKIAPFRTRSSFFTSALATLRLFTDWNIADITSQSDYTFSDTDEKKVITYIILPDEKTTYHPIGAIYIKQYYESLVGQALAKGGGLDRKFIFRIDEMGNFPAIPGFGTMLSAGAGRNIFFEIILQDEQQLESKYPEDFRNIQTNCQLTICLKVTDKDTTKTISSKLGSYTIETKSATSSITDGHSDSSSYSNAANLTGRPLLFPDEIADIQSPDALILYEGKKAITCIPDISMYYANAEFEMGNINHNKKLFLKRMEERQSREIHEPDLWGVWKEDGSISEEQKVSFL